MVSVSNLRRLGVVLVLALVLVVLALRQDTQVSAVGAAGSPISGKCTGEQQGAIRGGSTVKGREGTYPITALAHGITSPRDPASGQATGRRQHKPLSFTMAVDPSTPPLITALTNNERLTVCTFNFYRLSNQGGSQGREKIYFRVQLAGASVVDYALSGRPGGADTVTFSLVYETISWTWIDGGISAVDDWQTVQD